MVACGQVAPRAIGPLRVVAAVLERHLLQGEVVAGRKALSQDLSTRHEEAYSFTLCSLVWKFGAYAQCPSLRALRGLSTKKLQLC